ncbi:hypothetical protein ACFODZ_05050 [Marinicella sediminis]|uniref:Secreted protein n=1 Tax=Marinicella sediminis TaxID=1792834 RepID=A0ABV7J685_9GAMM|nr:hypothetical protein [Marinicella sediminis]
MSNRLTHTFIVVFLLALSANMVHTISVHEQGVCDICLHIQSSDDSDVAAELFTSNHWPSTQHGPVVVTQPLVHQTVPLQQAPRGPPVFS